MSVEQDQTTLEESEESLVDAASAARTVAELDVEIEVLDELVELATEVRGSGTDCKWLELRSILEDHELTRDETGSATQDHHLHRTPRHAAVPGGADPRAPGQRTTPWSRSTAGSRTSRRRVVQRAFRARPRHQRAGRDRCRR